MNMAKQKTKVYDFRKVSMEVEIGVFQELGPCRIRSL